MAALCIQPVLGAPDIKASPEQKRALDLAAQLEDAFTAVVDHAKPGVVVITNKRFQPEPRAQQIPPELRRFFGLPYEEPETRPGRQSKPFPVGRGSGVIIRDTGYVVTNYHVIEDADALEVKLEDGKTFDNERDENAVKVVGVDRETDLAVLQIGNGELSGLPTLPFADSNKIRVGQWAIAIGAPFNLDYSVTVGHVSQKGRYDVGMTTFENYIQTDASINPGNSGGPLLNIRGELVGINEFIMTGGGMSRGSIGLGFAIASNLVRQVVEDLIEHGKVIRPFLGITMQELTDELKNQFDVDEGVLVNQVLKGDPADKAGVEPGDVILKVGDSPVRTPHDVLFAVLAFEPGDMIKLTIDRRGKKMEIDVKARQRGADEGGNIEIADRQDILDQMGLALEETPDGVFVSAVVGGGPADYAEVRRGDQILEVNRVEVKTIEDVVKAFEKTKNNVVVLYIDRRGSKFFVGIPIGKDGEKDKDNK
jgi:serine protease Do